MAAGGFQDPSFLPGFKVISTPDVWKKTSHLYCNVWVTFMEMLQLTCGVVSCLEPHDLRLFTPAVAARPFQVSSSCEVQLLPLIASLIAEPCPQNRKANRLTCSFAGCLLSSAFVRSDKPKMFRGLQIKVRVTKP